ncbi:CG15473, partial [Drosophila busckii]
MSILQLPLVTPIVARDVLLTPKPGQQLSGKRLYYLEQAEQSESRAWERTLKHVTYVTLFTDAAVGAAGGNLSQLHDYHDFLQTPYVPAADQTQLPSSRFGDIVTLASGRLEWFAANGSYRFIEGATTQSAAAGAAAPGRETRALWQVQRIRHREPESQPQRFHYELKFSISPLTLTHPSWPPQSYIQRESDYPQSFGRVAYAEQLAQRRQDQRQRLEPQATFVRGIFQSPPPPAPPNLNIGEYLQLPHESAAAIKQPSKLELLPGLFNLGLRPNYIPATTYRPSYPLKFNAPERYPLPNELAGSDAAAAPPEATPVTHHFHHHFYMTPNGLIEAHQPRPSVNLQELSTPPPAYQHHHHHHGQHHGLSYESLESGEDQPHLHHQHQQALLSNPQLYPAYEQPSSYQRFKLPPLLIYAGSGGSTTESETQEAHKQFVHSEPLEETIYRYSEPDPLYVQEQPVDVLHLEQEQEPEQQHEEEKQQLPVELEQQLHAGSQKQLATAATTSSSTTTTSTTTTAAPTAVSTPASFVSSSTSSTPLRALSRYRSTPRITAGRSTTTTTSTTTAQPALKWQVRRRENATDSKPKSSQRLESKVAFPNSTTTTTTTPTTTTTTTTPLPVPNKRELVEVLTQKSVSKSVSIKVGEHGEEVPIIVEDVDEQENE